MEQLTNTLRREQALLELLLFKLVETRLLLSAEEIRFLPRSTREVEHARQRTRGADLARAAVVEGLGSTSPAGIPVTLRGLAAQAGHPWAGMLRDHHDAMCALVDEIELVAHHNARQATEGLQRLRRRSVTTPTAADGPSRVPNGGDPNLSQVGDHTAFDAVLGAASRLRMPALLAFLR